MPGAKSTLKVDLSGFALHNGEGRPRLRFPDPVSGELIGGQLAAMRMSMRYRHTVLAWARRQGKTRGRMALYLNEAAITPKEYRAGIVLPDHTTAFKIWEAFKTSYGGLVRNARGDDKSQDRWIELQPNAPHAGEPPPRWFTPAMADRWRRAQKGKKGDVNTLCKIWFWGGAYPHFEKIQGFPFPFQRIDWDECPQIHPAAYPVVRPMLRDVKGSECFSGTPMRRGIGNVQFGRWWDIAGQPTSLGWFRMRIPDGTNPHVPATPLEEARLTMSEDDIRETMFAEFLTDAGAVFSNFERVFILKPLAADDPAIDWVRALRARYAMPSVAWWVSQPVPIKGHVYGASIDWARSPRGDYSALTVFDFTTGRQVFLARWRGEDFTAQMEVVLAVAKHYGAHQLHADANGMGETMADFMRRRHAVGFVGHKFGRNKPDYVRRGQILFRDTGVALIDCLEQRKEFKDFSAYEAEGLGSEKQVKYCAPEGEHDDLVAAFLHLAPTLTIVGRQEAVADEPAAQPVFEPDHATTTLERFCEGSPTPWREDDGLGPTWQDVILPPRYR